MRAVNLIPADARRGGGAGAGGRSGGAAYILLGGLAVLVAVVSVWALAGHGIAGKRDDLARIESETNQAQAQSSQLAEYARYTKLRQDRVNTVRSLALSRFDWAKALDAVARTMPNDAWLTTMTGTVTPGVAVEGGGSSAGNLRSERNVPAIEIVGCTTSQSKVARLISRLRAVPGVNRVALADSTKADATGGGGDNCRGIHGDYPQFNMVLFFGNDVPPVGPASPTPTGAAAAAAPAPAPAQSSTSNGGTTAAAPAPSGTSATPSSSPSSGGAK